MTSPEKPGDAPDPRRWITLFVLLTAGFMNLIDITIVNVALPSLQADLAASSSQIEWIVAGYVLAFALGLLPFGRLGDIVGKRMIFIAGVGGFTAMSAFCGLAPNIEALVVARILQGLAGAMMMPQVLAIMQNIFPPHERGTAFAMFGLSASFAAVTGPIVGGFLINLDLFGLDWRPIFLINLPIGVLAIVATLRLVPPIAGDRTMTNDWVGIVIATFSVFLLVEGRTFDWPIWCFAMMLASVPGFALFVYWQSKREKAGASQLLPFSLLTNRNYLVGTFTIMAFFSGIPGLFMILALFLQVGFGLSPLDSGLATTPFPIGIFLASTLSGWMGQRWLKQRLIAGAAILICGMIWTRQTILGVGSELDHWIFVGPLFLSGIGMGTAIAVMFQVVLAGVPQKDAGSGSGSLQAFQQMGGAIGVAIIGQIFFSTLASGAVPDQALFVAAASNAMIYDVGMFVLVIVLTLFLDTANGSSQMRNVPHVPVEA